MHAFFLPWTRDVDEVLSPFRFASRRAEQHLPVDSSSGSLPWLVGRQVEEYCAPLRWTQPLGPRHFLLASFAALLLQWGTAGAAVIIRWYTPTVGLGCRSGSYLIYAAVSTDLGVACYIQYSYPRHLSPHRHWSLSRPSESVQYRNVARFLAITLRRLGKLLAACNAIWIVLGCLLQFGNFYNWCYCNSCAISNLGAALTMSY
jgi:hypothetical protein